MVYGHVTGPLLGLEWRPERHEIGGAIRDWAKEIATAWQAEMDTGVTGRAEASRDMIGRRLVGFGLLALGGGLAASAVLGPLMLKVIEYPVSDAMENQIVGGDLSSLAVAAPAAIVAGVLWLRRHRLAPALALGPTLYALYYAVSLVVGEQYERYPGNVGKFFPLYLGLTVLGWTLAAQAWSALKGDKLPEPDARLRRVTAGILLALGTLLGLAWTQAIWGVASGTRVTEEYLGDPNVFWSIKLLDTAFIIPVALATGVGLLRHNSTAKRAATGIMGYLTCQGAAVTGMAVVMAWRGDPSASIPFLVLVGIGTLSLAILTALWFRLDAVGESTRVRVRGVAQPV